MLFLLILIFTVAPWCYGGKYNSDDAESLLWNVLRTSEHNDYDWNSEDPFAPSLWNNYRQCLRNHCVSLNNDEELLPIRFNCDHRDEDSEHNHNASRVLSFYQCLLTVSREHNQQVMESGNPVNIDGVAFHGPQLPLFAMVTFLTKDIVDYTVYSIAVNLAFAIYHNHVFYVIDDFLTNRCSNQQLNGNDTRVGNDVQRDFGNKYCATLWGSRTNRREDAAVPTTEASTEIDLSLDSYDNRWSKVGILLTMVNSLDKTYTKGMDEMVWEAHQADYFIWLDADLIVLNLIHFRLQDIISEYPKAHLLASAEHAGSTTMINSGCLLIKNSQWSRSFLQQWWEIQDRKLLSDQEQFDLLYQTLLSREQESSDQQKQIKLLEEKIKILPPYALNSDPPAMTKQQEHHPVLHLMGEEKDFRIRSLSAATAHLLEHLEFIVFQTNHNLVKPVQALHSQLTLTQKNLLIWTIEEYSGCVLHKNFIIRDRLCETTRISKLFSDYEALANHGFADVEAGRYLSNVIHHFAFAIEYLHSNPSIANSREDMNFVHCENTLRKLYPLSTVKAMRIQVYQLLYFNVKQLQQRLDEEKASVLMIGRPFRYPRDYPELVKSVAIAGQQLLLMDMKDIEDLGIFNKEQIAVEVEDLLQEMLDTANEKQHEAIYHMIAHHKIQRCMLGMEKIGNYIELDLDGVSIANLALSNCQDSLTVFERLVSVSGSHILVNPLMLTANLLSTLRRFPEAYQYYDIAIQLVKSSDYGSVHDPLSIVIPLFLNYGTALVQGYTHESSEVHFNQMISIMDECRKIILNYRSMTKDPRELELLTNYLSRVELYLEQIKK